MHLLVLPFGRDQAIFAVVADTMLAGGAPYKDAWDFKTPGIFFVYACAQLLFGPAETGLRIAEIATLCLGLWAAYRISAEAVDRRAVFFIAPVFLFGITQYGFWHVGQPEVFGAALVLLAICLSSMPQALWAVAALYVCAALLKPPLGGGILISYAFALYAAAKAGGSWRGTVSVTLQFALGAAAVLGALFLYLKITGSFEDFYWTLFVFTPNYTGVGNVQHQLAGLAGLFIHGLKKLVMNWPVLSAGVFLFLGLGLRGWTVAKWSLHLILVAGMTLLGVALQAKFFPYHYAATVGLCAVLAGWGYWALYIRLARWPLGGLLALCAMVVPMFLSRASLRYWENGVALASVAFAPPQERAAVTDKLYSTGSMDRRSNLDAVAWARKHVPEDEPIYVWGFEPIIYLQSGRRPASRFIYNVAQRAEWSAGQTRAELMRSLEANDPFAIFVQSQDIMPAVTGSGLDSRQTLDREFPELRALLGSGYTHAADTGRFRIYQRKP
ncbi:hypothetical protein ETW24_22395 (plasmid) [Leisingera sp. NJS204]|nr:hypothetical protein ETW24_22395 [Leisingera sp. NJS204]